MRKRIVALAGAGAALLFLGATALAAQQRPANVAGAWQLVFAGRKSRTERLVLEQDGAEIKGTLGALNAEGGLPFTGTVDGNKIAFGMTASNANGQTDMSVKFMGTANGDAMTGTVEVVHKGYTGFESFMDTARQLSWTAKRQK